MDNKDIIIDMTNAPIPEYNTSNIQTNKQFNYGILESDIISNIATTNTNIFASVCNFLKNI